MKAITLTQPWATLVAVGAKRIETRGWRTEYRGLVAIHAAKGFPDDARYIATTEPFRSALGGGLATELPRGAIVAVANLVTCFPFTPDTVGQIRERSILGRLPAHEADFGDYTPGRFGFVLADVIALREPVEARGQLNLWNLPNDIAAQVAAAVDGLRLEGAAHG